MKLRFSRNLFIIVTIDIFLLCISFYLAHLIRFDFIIPDWATDGFLGMLPYVLGVKLFCFYFFDLYKGMWRYTSLNDLMSIVKACTAATFGLIVFILFKNRFEMVSRSVFIIDWCLTLMSIISVRIITRLCFEEFTADIGFRAVFNSFLKIFKRGQRKGKGVIIIGAGDFGQKMCRE